MPNFTFFEQIAKYSSKPEKETPFSGISKFLLFLARQNNLIRIPFPSTHAKTHYKSLVSANFIEIKPEVERNLIQQAISQTFQSTAHLANLLPTGSVLAFQLLSPIFSNQGECDSVSRAMTAGLVALCGMSCLLLSFTDSIQDQKGKVCYGFATFSGFWIIDGSAAVPPAVAAKYKLKFIDFAHALMSILVFGAVAMFDQNVVKCFFPEPSTGTTEMLTALPVGVGVICSMLFVAFPTQRHGIGFPVTLLISTAERNR